MTTKRSMLEQLLGELELGGALIKAVVAFSTGLHCTPRIQI